MFNQYPYINLNDLNLDYILKAIKEMRYEVTNFVSINAIKYADPIQWNITSQYEKNTIVIDPQTGTAYISVAPVPAGVALTRPEYWTVVFDLGAFVTRAAKNFTSRYEQDTTLTATFPTTAGEWLVWGDVLYKALVNITAGDTYVIGSNIEHFTMEELYASVMQLIADNYDAIVAMIGDLDDLTTTAKNNVVAAINELVDAINDEAQARQGADGTLQDNIDAEVRARQDADDAINNSLIDGTLSAKFHLLELECNESGADVGDHNTLTILRTNDTGDAGKQTGSLIIRGNIGENCHHHEFGSFDIIHNLSHDGALEHAGHYAQITNEGNGSDSLWALVGEVKDVWQDNLYPQAVNPSNLCGLELDCVTHFTPENADGKKRLALSLVALGGGIADYGLFISAGNGADYDYGKFRNGIVIEENSLDPTLGMGIYSKSDCGSGLVMIGRTQNYAVQLQSTGSFGLAITGTYQYPLLLTAGSKISLNGVTPNNNIYYDDTTGAVTVDSPAIGLANHTAYTSASAGGVEPTPASVTGYIGVYVNGYLKKIPYYNI